MAALMMVVVRHSEHRAAIRAEDTFTPGFFFDNFTERETQLPQPCDDGISFMVIARVGHRVG
jgi:hypothetical protein